MISQALLLDFLFTNFPIYLLVVLLLHRKMKYQLFAWILTMTLCVTARPGAVRSSFAADSPSSSLPLLPRPSLSKVAGNPGRPRIEDTQTTKVLPGRSFARMGEKDLSGMVFPRLRRRSLHQVIRRSPADDVPEDYNIPARREHPWRSAVPTRISPTSSGASSWWTSGPAIRQSPRSSLNSDAGSVAESIGPKSLKAIKTPRTAGSGSIPTASPASYGSLGSPSSSTSSRASNNSGFSVSKFVGPVRTARSSVRATPFGQKPQGSRQLRRIQSAPARA